MYVLIIYSFDISILISYEELCYFPARNEYDFLPSAVHISCIVENGEKTDDSRVVNGDKTDDSRNTFCGNKCQEV
jgi:hypothetical protein